jgi:hypothetical protein
MWDTPGKRSDAGRSQECRGRDATEAIPVHADVRPEKNVISDTGT